MSKDCKNTLLYKPDESLFVLVGANKMEGGGGGLITVLYVGMPRKQNGCPYVRITAEVVSCEMPIQWPWEQFSLVFITYT